jgi:hypothetical protein
MINQPTPESGRTVIVRGPKGEVVISSSFIEDNLQTMIGLAEEAYNKNKVTKNTYIN